jgi:hypothetical protein
MTNSIPTIVTFSLRMQEETIRVARQLFVTQFPTEDFDADVWDLRSLIYRPGVLRSRRLHFMRLNMPDSPLPQYYVQIIKSWIILDGKGLGDRSAKLRLARFFWEVLLQRHRDTAADVLWENLTSEDLCQTEVAFLTTTSATMAYSLGTCLKTFADFLAIRHICPFLHFTSQIPKTATQRRHISQEREGKPTHLPTQKALEALADVYHLYAKEPQDRLRIAALALLVVSGFRAGELLTLPFECEVEEIYRGKARYGLRYYREKSRGGHQMLAIRWLTSTGAELARKAVREIKEITEPFRQQARLLEGDLERIPIPGFAQTDTMTVEEVAHVLGMKRSGSIHQISPEKLPRHGVRRKTYFLASEVEAYLLTQRKSLWTLSRRDGTYQLLSESLLISPRNFFRQISAGVNIHLVEPVNYGHLRQFLVSWESNTSAFERFNIRENDGSFCKMSTHQLRHWLNDIADKGGLPLDVQTRWMGRENPRETHAYHHATVEERLQWVKEGIRGSAIGGMMADVYFQLAEEERDLFLEGQIQAVHVTALGMCLHDFSIDPCPYHLNCVRGCQDYVRIKGSQEERKQLIQIRVRTEQARQCAEEGARKNGTLIAEPWLRHYEETLAGVDAALMIDNEPEADEGAAIRPFEKKPSKFEPLSR